MEENRNLQLQMDENRRLRLELENSQRSNDEASRTRQEEEMRVQEAERVAAERERALCEQSYPTTTAGSSTSSGELSRMKANQHRFRVAAQKWRQFYIGLAEAELEMRSAEAVILQAGDMPDYEGVVHL